MATSSRVLSNLKEYCAFSFAVFVGRCLPRPLGYWVGLRLADHHYRTHPEVRRAVMANLSQVLRWRGVQASGNQLEGLTRKTFQYYGKYLADFFRFRQLSGAQLERLVSFEHPEYLTQALAAGRGVIMVTPHFGNYELGGAVLASLGHPVSAVFRPMRLGAVDRLLHRQRQRRGVRPIPLGRAAAETLRILRRGEIVALLGDRDFSGRSEPIEFFGRPAIIPRGPAALAAHTGAAVVFAVLLREVDETFRLRLHPPLTAGPGDAERLRAQLCRRMEIEIGNQPHQWYIFEDFWSQTDGETNHHAHA
ncbi:MAG: lysophospholipid acyltransferase family protein [Candidatus Marinimicrobia bacterium]|nr:lysophospholipid acyltransferase family protein [Candidatus Neomarinimicrobiota bacterium]